MGQFSHQIPLLQLSIVLEEEEEEEEE